MNLSRPVIAMKELEFQIPTKIQAADILVALKGKDICAAGVTGYGKTAAFLIPIIERLMYCNEKTPQTRVLILLPTRELAIQCFEVVEKLTAFTKIQSTLAVGGLNLKKQEMALQSRPDFEVATPGWLIDHMRKSFSLDSIEILVLGEADRMLEIGFTDELNENHNEMPQESSNNAF